MMRIRRGDGTQPADAHFLPLALALAIVLGAGLYAWRSGTFAILPPATAAPEQGSELLAAFRAGKTASQAADARAFAALCRAIADTWEYDGQQGTPRLTRQAHLAELRQLAREFRLRGASLSASYPQLPKALDDYLSPLIPSGKGSGAVEVTSEIRRRWVESHRQLAAAADWAASQF